MEGVGGVGKFFFKNSCTVHTGAVIYAPVYRSPVKPGGKGRAGEALPEPSEIELKVWGMRNIGGVKCIGGL